MENNSSRIYRQGDNSVVVEEWAEGSLGRFESCRHNLQIKDSMIFLKNTFLLLSHVANDFLGNAWMQANFHSHGWEMYIDKRENRYFLALKNVIPRDTFAGLELFFINDSLSIGALNAKATIQAHELIQKIVLLVMKNCEGNKTNSCVIILNGNIELEARFCPKFSFKNDTEDLSSDSEYFSDDDDSNNIAVGELVNENRKRYRETPEGIAEASQRERVLNHLGPSPKFL
jgi:hypothetical protein